MNSSSAADRARVSIVLFCGDRKVDVYELLLGVQQAPTMVKNLQDQVEAPAQFPNQFVHFSTSGFQSDQMARSHAALRLLLLVAFAAACAHAAVVINTWPFVDATRAAFAALTASPSPPAAHLDAVTAGCARCETDQCDFTVGFGGSPDSSGETTLDAMILDGSRMDMGAVAQLRRVKPAIRVARAVLHHSAHSVLAGDGALAFAKMMGFTETPLDTPHSRALHAQWLRDRCQPNYFRNVAPPQNESCPPFQPVAVDYGDAHWRHQQQEDDVRAQRLINARANHDTIGMVALSAGGDMAGAAQLLTNLLEWTCSQLTPSYAVCAAGTSSNGANHKIAGCASPDANERE